MSELIDIVDKDDIVIGQDTKENKFEKEFISRNVAIFIKDSNNNFIIVKRAPTKKSFPNRLDLAACGNVDTGETPEKAAAREIKEELGISCSIKFLKKIFNEFPENDKMRRYFTYIFLAGYDGKISLNNELTDYRKMALKELKEKINSSPNLFCPLFIKDFKEVEDLL